MGNLVPIEREALNPLQQAMARMIARMLVNAIREMAAEGAAREPREAGAEPEPESG